MKTSRRERQIPFSEVSVKAILNGNKTQTRRIVKPNKSNLLPIFMKPWMIDSEQEVDDYGSPCWIGMNPKYETGEKWFSCPYGKPKDILWVKEPWRPIAWNDGDEEVLIEYKFGGKHWKSPGSNDSDFAVDALVEWACNQLDKAGVKLVDDKYEWDGEIPIAYRASIFMPRWISRINLEVTNVRVERLQDISEEDAIAEGIHRYEYTAGELSPYCPMTEERAKEIEAIAFGTQKLALGCMERNAITAFRRLWDSINSPKGYSWDSNPWVWVIDFKKPEE